MKITNNVQIDKTIRSLANTIEKTAKHKYLIDLSESLTIHLTAFVLGEYKKQGLVSLSLEKYIVQNKKNISFGTYKGILDSTAKFLADINSPSIISHLLLKESKELIHLDRFKKAFNRYKTLIEKGEEVDFNKEIKNAISNQGGISLIEFLGCVVTLRNRYSHPHYELKNGQMVQWPTTDSTYYDILNPILEDALNETIQKLNNIWEFRQYLVENNEGGILTLREPHNQIDNIVEVHGNYPEGVLVFANEKNDILLSDWKILTKPSEEALEGIRKEEEELRNKATIEDLKNSIKSALNDEQISLDELNFFESLGKTKLGIAKDEIKKIILEVANSMGIEDPFPEVDKRFIELIDNAINTRTYNEFLLKLTGQQYGVDNETFEKVFSERTFALNVDPDEVRKNKVLQFSIEELTAFQGLMSTHKWLMSMHSLSSLTKESIFKIKNDSYVFGTKEYWHRNAFQDLETFVKGRLNKLAIDDDVLWETNQNNWQIGAMTSYAWCSIFPKNLATKKILALHLSLYSKGDAAIGYLPDWKDYKDLQNYGLLLHVFSNHLKSFVKEYEIDLNKYPNLVLWDSLNNNRYYSFTDSMSKFPWFYEYIYGFDQIQFYYTANEIISNPSILIDGFDITFNLFNGLFENVNRDYLNMLNGDYLIFNSEKKIRKCLTDLEPLFVNYGLCESLEDEIEPLNNEEDGATKDENTNSEEKPSSNGLNGNAYLGYFAREFRARVKGYPMAISINIKQDYLSNKLNFLIYISCAGYLESTMHEPVEQILESMQDLQYDNAQFYFKRSKFLMVLPIEDINSFDAVPITNFFLNHFSTQCGKSQTKFLGLRIYSPLIESLKPSMDQAIDQMNESMKDLFSGQMRSERRWMSGCRYIDYVNGSKSVPSWAGWGFIWRDSQLFAGITYHVRDSIKGAALMGQMENLANNGKGWQFQIVGEAEHVSPDWILQENHTFKLSASTEHSKPHTAAHALMSNRKTYWAAKIKNEEQWWQLESKEPLIFSKLKLTGSPIGNSYMQLFNISYSMDGSNWQTLENIEGINDGFELKEIQFDEVITARQIRIHPIKYTGWPGFRIDFLAKKMMPNKIELQWLVPISNEAQIDPVVSQISTKIQEIKNLEGSTI